MSTVSSSHDAGNALGDAAFEIATRGAWAYLRQHGLQASPDALLACLKSWCRIKLPEALRDAKAALDAHMPQVAEQTFALTMMSVGIEAAKEAGFPDHSAPPVPSFSVTPAGATD